MADLIIEPDTWDYSSTLNEAGGCVEQLRLAAEDQRGVWGSETPLDVILTIIKADLPPDASHGTVEPIITCEGVDNDFMTICMNSPPEVFHRLHQCLMATATSPNLKTLIIIDADGFLEGKDNPFQLEWPDQGMVEVDDWSFKMEFSGTGRPLNYWRWNEF